ncbi:hypothetical protein KAX06_05950 [candidate division WOR-3 bacterium]|nr:hypothetical protein [candidate division WOR-3 bacterium]
MDPNYVQNLRYKLQKRMRRVNGADSQVLHAVVQQFWGYINSNSIFLGILEKIEHNIPEEIQGPAINIPTGNLSGPFYPEDEKGLVALSYLVLKGCIERSSKDSEINAGLIYSLENSLSNASDLFKSLFVEPLYDYLDEQLDDQRAILALLRKYKHKCEWFQRDKLFELWKNNTQKGERLLAMHLYEYLHDQGLDFSIEPQSISGEADLVAAQKSDDPLIADVKIFNAPNKKSYIAKGFTQIYRYTRDYSEPFGYLIIFNTSNSDLKLVLSHQEQSTPFVVYNGKTIFMLTIDIYPIEATASKEGKLKTVQITEKDLVKVIEETEQ